MKKTVLFLCVLLIFSQSGVYGNESSYTNAPGKAAIVMDVNTGRILYEKNINEAMPMASTTKIMTALLAIENTAPDHMVKVNPEAIGIEGSSIYLRANERVSMVDLLYGLMLRSGNDAAAAIAFEIGGSIEDFASLMNQRAKELGAKNTSFMNPHGLHHEDHYTTAYDLALITQAALREPLFKEIVSTKFWVADRGEYKHFSNKNKILGSCEGGDGVKTGYTQRAGRCLVASASRNEMQLIAITLDDYDWFNTAMTLLDDSFNAFTAHRALEKHQAVTNVPVLNGKEKDITLLASNEVLLPLGEEEISELEMVLAIPDVIKAPLAKGEKLGTASFYLKGQLLKTTDLFTDKEIGQLTLKDKLLRLFKRSDN